METLGNQTHTVSDGGPDPPTPRGGIRRKFCPFYKVHEHRSHSMRLSPNYSGFLLNDKVSAVKGRDDSWPATVPSVMLSYSRADNNLIGPAALRSDVLALLHSIHFTFTVIFWSLQLRICPPIRYKKYSSFMFWPGYAQFDLHLAVSVHSN